MHDCGKGERRRRRSDDDEVTTTKRRRRRSDDEVTEGLFGVHYQKSHKTTAATAPSPFVHGTRMYAMPYPIARVTSSHTSEQQTASCCATRGGGCMQHGRFGMSWLVMVRHTTNTIKRSARAFACSIRHSLAWSSLI